MVIEIHDSTGHLPARVLSMMCLLSWVLALGWLTGAAGLPGALEVALVHFPVAALIFLAAGGWGFLALRLIIPRTTPAGLFAVTCVVVGLWLLGTGVLIIGSMIPGGLSGWVWWVILLVGVGAALSAGREQLMKFRIPGRVNAANMFWILPAIAAGIWFAGASLPPGMTGAWSGDVYDVLSYHLQVPREFVQQGHISELPHNTYSYYPFNAQMLFLLAAVLKGGAYEGAYVATITHGLWGVLAMAALYAAFPGLSPYRRRAAAVLFACMPWTIYLGWLAFVELSQIAYLAVALAWLLRWQQDSNWRSAAMVGFAAGASCGAKYLSVGLVAAPLLLIMLMSALPGVCKLLGASASKPALRSAVLAMAVAVVPFLPWLVRNVVYTGNPVFPLATSILGQGHWTAEQAQRWDAAHAPPTWQERPRLLLAGLIGSPEDQRSFGILLLLIVAAAAVWVVARGRRSETIDRACLILLLMQIAAWAATTHMPGRFITPAAVPMAILAGGFIEWLAQLRRPAKRMSIAVPAPAPPGGFLTATVLLIATAGLNLALAGMLFRQEPRIHVQNRPVGLNGMPAAEMRDLPGYREIYAHLTPADRILLVAEAQAFYFPNATVYNSVWERGPLLQAVRQNSDPGEIMRYLRLRGITHLWLNWSEIARLRATYGWWTEINEAMIDGLIAAGAVQVDLYGPDFNRMPDGRPVVQFIALPK